MRKFENHQVSYLKLDVSNVEYNQIKWENLDPIKNSNDLFRLQAVDDCYHKHLQLCYDEQTKIASFTIQVPLFSNNKIDEKIGVLELLWMTSIIDEKIGIDITNALIAQITCSVFMHTDEQVLIEPFLHGHTKVTRWDNNSTLSISNVSSYITNKTKKYCLRYDMTYFDVDQEFDQSISFLDCIKTSNFQKALMDPFEHPLSTEMKLGI